VRKEFNTKDIMLEIVERLKGVTPEELLSYAIMNEEAEVRYYAELAEMAKKPSVKTVFRRMSEESEKHAHLLRRLFKRMFPEEEPAQVEIPPVEVAPFYPKFETVGDYFEALEYCMDSELFAKMTYELLSSNVEDERVRELAINLAVMETKHYEELRKVYELLKTLTEREIFPEILKPGGYLFTDDLKAMYFLLELLESGVKVKALLRQRSQGDLLEVAEDIEVLWVTKTETENAVEPLRVPELKKELSSFLKELSDSGRKGAVFIQNLCYFVAELGFKKTMDFVLYLKDSAVLYGGYVIVTSNPEAFEKREWAILTSELELIP